ncbi:response regulator transcription factor [Cohnella sp. JJ-181]|uniref:response regulator transcription factor n=1 Tax=Cohnella rhizoplanae TaxID=2974897 RepID=UPI0022FF91CC|nr:response regulator transcription factor [Cohnella sp. JJ-181]CAI6072161.1 Regulator of RpoS [Cohnella sp. JJ-181]
MYKVFIVDDEPFIAEGLMDAIDWAAFGLEVVGSAENGEEALRRIRRTPVDLLITDISMPRMNGLNLIRAARESRPDLMAIILSGFNEFDYLKEGMRLGIENYLLKPINVKELHDTLGNAVEKLNSVKPDALLSQYNVQIMKDNTLYRWISGRISEAEFNERAALLGISLTLPSGVIALMRWPDALSEAQEKAFERIVRAFEGSEDAYPFRDMDGDIVLVAGLRSEEEGKRDLVGRLLPLLGQAGAGEGARLSLGGVHPLRTEIAASYREAKKAQEFFMIYPERAWIDYAETETFIGAEPAEFPIDWEAYRKLLVARDKEGLSSAIEADFERLRRLDGVTPAYLHEVSVELIVRFKMELKAIKHADEPEMFSQSIGQAYAATDYAELSRTVRSVAERCVDSLVQDSRSPVVLQVLEEIHRHYADELSLKQLGVRYHIHPVYLGQLFQKETGESFTEYINKYRIEQAKKLLKSSTLKVHDIARQAGYWETGYFYKQFKKYVGISPTEFKGLR